MPGVMSVVIDEKGDLVKHIEKLAGFDKIASPHFEQAMHTAVAMGKSKVISELREVAEQNRSAMISGLGGDMTPAGPGVQALAPVNPKVPSFRITSLVQTQGVMNVIGIVGDMNRKYLRLTEAGRGPGRHPPARVMQDWAENVLGVQPGPSRTTKKGRVIRDLTAGRAIAHAIAARGIKGSPVMEKSGEAIEKHILQLFDTELRKIAAELGYK